MSSNRVYVLDPGHGGINPKTGKYVTSGKRSPEWSDGTIYYEGVGNREIASKVGRNLKALGIAFAYTVVPSDFVDVSLSERVNRVNLLHKTKKCVLISIHSNAAKDRSAKGYEVFTSPGQTTSDSLATILFKEFSKIFKQLKGRTAFQDGDPDKEAKFTMVAGPKCPAMLIETMFHTNETECKILLSEEGKEKIATAITNAIVEMEKQFED